MNIIDRCGIFVKLGGIIIKHQEVLYYFRRSNSYTSTWQFSTWQNGPDIDFPWISYSDYVRLYTDIGKLFYQTNQENEK